MLPNFSYIRPKTIKDAVKQLSSEGSGVLAGGTDLLGCLHDSVFPLKKVVSITDLADLRGTFCAGRSIKCGQRIVEALCHQPLLRCGQTPNPRRELRELTPDRL